MIWEKFCLATFFCWVKAWRFWRFLVEKHLDRFTGGFKIIKALRGPDLSSFLHTSQNLVCDNSAEEFRRLIIFLVTENGRKRPKMAVFWPFSAFGRPPDGPHGHISTLQCGIDH